MRTNNHNNIIPSEIQDYLDSLLREAGVEPLSKEIHQTMMEELYVELERYTVNRIIENMPLEYIETFLKLQEAQNSAEEKEAFLIKHIPNINQVYLDSFLEFKKMYIESVRKAKDATNKTQNIIS